MELKIEAKNLDIRKSWQEKIEEERDKIIRHYASLVLHLRVTIEATPGYKEGGHEVRVVATVPNDTVVVKLSDHGTEQDELDTVKVFRSIARRL